MTDWSREFRPGEKWRDAGSRILGCRATGTSKNLHFVTRVSPPSAETQNRKSPRAPPSSPVHSEYDRAPRGSRAPRVLWIIRFLDFPSPPKRGAIDASRKDRKERKVSIRAEARGDGRERSPLRSVLCFNPRPAPKRGAISRLPTICELHPRFNPRPAPKRGAISSRTNRWGDVWVSIRAPRRSAGRSVVR